jgi:hypothetical protein
VYALLSVPIITNVIVQCVVGCLDGLADKYSQKAKDRRAPENSELELYESHANNVVTMTERLKSTQAAKTSDRELGVLILSLAVKLEAQSRALLMESLPVGSKARVLMRADRALAKRVQDALEPKISHNHPSTGERTAYELVRSMDKEMGKDEKDKREAQQEDRDDSCA